MASGAATEAQNSKHSDAENAHRGRLRHRVRRIDIKHDLQWRRDGVTDGGELLAGEIHLDVATYEIQVARCKCAQRGGRIDRHAGERRGVIDKARPENRARRRNDEASEVIIGDRDLPWARASLGKCAQQR